MALEPSRADNQATLKALIDKHLKVIAWLGRLAEQADKEAEINARWSSLAGACRADARNYRAVAADIKTVLPKTALAARGAA